MRGFVVVLIAATCAHAQPSTSTAPMRRDTTAKSIVLGIHLATSMTPSAAAAFAAYQRTLGGGARAFPAMSGVGGSASIDLSPVFSVLLQAQAFTLALDDAGNFGVKNSTTGVYDTSTQSTEHWTAQTYPFLAGVRYTPVASRFQSYGFLLAGIAITHLRWDHATISSTDPSRFPSANFEATTVAPSFAVGAGIELVFDQFHRREILRGMTLEARYRWTESTFNIFGPIAEHSSAPAPEWRSPYPMNFSGFEMLIGLHFQFYRTI